MEKIQLQQLHVPLIHVNHIKLPMEYVQDTLAGIRRLNKFVRLSMLHAQPLIHPLYLMPIASHYQDLHIHGIMQ
jgi:hypothetical protein